MRLNGAALTQGGVALTATTVNTGTYLPRYGRRTGHPTVFVSETFATTAKDPAWITPGFAAISATECFPS